MRREAFKNKRSGRFELDERSNVQTLKYRSERDRENATKASSAQLIFPRLGSPVADLIPDDQVDAPRPARGFMSLRRA